MSTPLEPTADPARPGGETFGQAILGRDFFRQPWLAKVMAWPAEWRLVAAIAGLGALLYIPYLGAVGLWDPWETHYGEVARQMVHRNDYVYMWWESNVFFSKPPFTMWMQALGLLLAGAGHTEGKMPLFTEWCMRMPFALFSIAALSLLGMALSRVLSRRASLASMFALATMPMYWLLTRQAVTDTPFVSALMCGMACAIIGQLDPKTQQRSAWWYGFYVFAAIATLSKEIIGFAIPAAIVGVYFALCEMDWSADSLNAHVRWLSEPAFRAEVKAGKQPMPSLWAQFYRMRLGTGLLVFLAVAAPWYALMFNTTAVDEENKNFLQRIIWDNFLRVGSGVHTTTPGGTFTYFIEQGGYAIFPWVALLPGALVVVSRLKLRSFKPADQLATIAVLWTAISFLLMGASATKFHHYVFPVLPGAAILIGLFVDALWEDGIENHVVPLIFGLVLFILVGKDLASTPKDFTDLFVYNYDRPYPQELVERPLSWFGGRALFTGDLLAILLLAFGAYLVVDAFRSKGPGHVTAKATALGLLLAGGSLLGAMSTGGQLNATLFVGLSVLVVAVYLGVAATREKPEERPSLFALAAVAGLVGAGLVGMSVRSGAGDTVLEAVKQPVNIKLGLGVVFALGGGLCVIAALQRSRTLLFGSFWALAMAFALWFNWDHWVDLSHHWTQRDLFWRYWDQRKDGEPITAFLMNWRGETFYSRNTVKQIKENDLLARYAALSGRKWALVEHNRLGILRQAIGPNHTVTPIDRGINNKFVLVIID